MKDFLLIVTSLVQAAVWVSIFKLAINVSDRIEIIFAGILVFAPVVSLSLYFIKSVSNRLIGRVACLHFSVSGDQARTFLDRRVQGGRVKAETLKLGSELAVWGYEC